MKKFLLKSFSVLLAIVLITAQSQTLSAKPLGFGLPSVDEMAFDLDENALNLAFSELNELDSYLDENPGLTYTDLKEMGSELIINMSEIAAPMGSSQDNEATLGIPAFWWGCVLGWVGILLVYLLTDNDKVQTKKALTGCLINGGVVLVLYVAYAALWAGAATSYYY